MPDASVFTEPKLTPAFEKICTATFCRLDAFDASVTFPLIRPPVANAKLIPLTVAPFTTTGVPEVTMQPALRTRLALPQLADVGPGVDGADVVRARRQASRGVDTRGVDC